MNVRVIPSSGDLMSSPEPGLKRQVMSANAQLMLVRHTMTAGWVGARHSHPHDQLVYVVSGEIALTLELEGGAETYALRTGDSLLVPGDVAHQATAPVESEVLDVFTPARLDYL